ncbi:MAG TPA: beta-ketoacyl synthase N-terminal-like domain-containing protein [Spirochaetota bacterium]
MIGICGYASIRPGQFFVNEIRESVPIDDFAPFIKDVYVRSGIAYPKFYKMDNLSKLAFVTAEHLLRGTDLAGRCRKDEIGVILVAPHSSLDTDCRHHASIADGAEYSPSPAVFVYTLPNIMAGEICIRHGFQGENIVFAGDTFADDAVISYITALFDSGKIKAAICGVVDFFEEEFSSDLFLVEERTGNSQDVSDVPGFTREEIARILSKSI